MNDKNILIIGNPNEFLTKSVATVMEKRGYDSTCIKPELNEICQSDQSIKVYLMFVETADGIQDILIYLKDVVFDKRIKLCLVGERLEVAECMKYVQEENVSMTFSRPVDAKAISDGLEELYKEAQSDTEKKVILLVDDDPVFLRRTQMILKKYYKVYVVNSGASAIMLMTRHHVDLILLDYDMPIVSGPQVYEMIKNEMELSSIPIMFLTGKNDLVSVSIASNLKPEKYILKSEAVGTLLTEISDFFASQYAKKMSANTLNAIF